MLKKPALNMNLNLISSVFIEKLITAQPILFRNICTYGNMYNIVVYSILINTIVK